MGNIIEVNGNNIEREHVCCAISDKKSTQVKKEWMKERFLEGYQFWKADAQGKAFIEFVPAENAWTPIVADGYLFIDCFWVAGSLAKKGYGTALLERCAGEAERLGKKGLVAISSDKKRPFLSDPVFYKKRGFRTADTAQPYFELLYLPFDEATDVPRFRENAKKGTITQQGVVICYSDHCPWNAKYIPLLEKAAQERNAPVAFQKIADREAAQNAASPFTTFSVYYNGMFVTNEMMSDKKFGKFLNEKGF
ncbi:N-acetyltransferase [Christensenella intestinihominis]|uniref:N-acetyltransferase n=1 Tax=Christensenella intestinihominis TaxID=1851429 RepID=UPI00082D1FF0|nr:N-acetyltransferase [Christensenella intestinihominis]